MKCPHCGFENSKVLDSRDVDDGVRRRRQCLSCNSRFTTYERIQKSSLFVVKKDKRRELFDKSKLLNGIRKAFEKRPIAANVIEKWLMISRPNYTNRGSRRLPVRSSAIW